MQKENNNNTTEKMGNDKKNNVEMDNRNLKSIEEFKSEFENETLELLVKIQDNHYKWLCKENPNSFIRIGNYYKATASFYPALNLKTGRFIESGKTLVMKKGGRRNYWGNLVWLEKNNKYGIGNKYTFKENCIYHLIVRKSLQRINNCDVYFDEFLVEDVIKKKLYNKEIMDKEKIDKYYAEGGKYYNKYISNIGKSAIVIEHSYFGKCIFARDSKYKTLTLVDGMDMILGDNVIFDINFNVSENKINNILDSLEKIYKNYNKILNKSYPKILEIVKHWAKISRRRKIDIKYIKNNYRIDNIYVDDENVFFFGEVLDQFNDASFIDIQGSYICVNFESEEIRCNVVY